MYTFDDVLTLRILKFFTSRSGYDNVVEGGVFGGELFSIFMEV